MGIFISLSNILLLLCLTLSSCTTRATTLPFDYYEDYCIVDAYNNKVDKHWTDYLQRHLSKRCLSPKIVSRNFANNENKINISVHVDNSLGHEYNIVRTREEVRLIAKTEDVMLWLIYQFIAGVAQDDWRFNASDILPAVIEIQTQKANRAFELRSIYSPTNADGEMLSIRGTNHVDYDWALWGHNIWKIIGEKPDESVYALIDGKRSHEQYCFSSPALYSLIDEWVNDNYGKGTALKHDNFTIMPQDNALVCMCDECKKAGNTNNNATPAVTSMLLKLAKKYPNHNFFTSSYLTTVTPPKQKLPDNVGVFISAIDIPMQYEFKASKGYKAFNSMLESWKAVCNRIYIWEYDQNYDDYLTPYPCLYIMQKRMQYYSDAGVKGIFLNGSGDTYSSFDDLRTFVASALMVNPKTDVEKLITRFFKAKYPETADILTKYYQSLENSIKKSNKVLPLYDGISKAVETYLVPDEFESFWTTLDKTSKQIDTDERKLLSQLLTALSFTRMELLRLKPEQVTDAKKENILEVLSEYSSVPGLDNYREANGAMSAYLEAWNTQPMLAGKQNRLKGTTVTSNIKDGDVLPVSVLTDGRLGFSTDYHLNWLITGSKEFKVTVSKMPSAKGTLVISLLFAPQWRMWFPSSVEISQGSRSLAKIEPVSPTGDKEVFKKEKIEIPLHDIDVKLPLIITMRNSDRKRSTIACDEILFN